MKFSLSWLKEHLDKPRRRSGRGGRLNRIGLEVEGIENPAERLKGFTRCQGADRSVIRRQTSCRC
jgi:phenylalanyl-tRNA synthetase beta chain